MTPAALTSAIDDALRPLGVRVNALPATPERVLNWIERRVTSGIDAENVARLGEGGHRPGRARQPGE